MNSLFVSHARSLLQILTELNSSEERRQECDMTHLCFSRIIEAIDHHPFSERKITDIFPSGSGTIVLKTIEETALKLSRKNPLKSRKNFDTELEPAVITPLQEISPALWGYECEIVTPITEETVKYENIVNLLEKTFQKGYLIADFLSIDLSEVVAYKHFGYTQDNRLIILDPGVIHGKESREARRNMKLFLENESLDPSLKECFQRLVK